MTSLSDIAKDLRENMESLPVVDKLTDNQKLWLLAFPNEKINGKDIGLSTNAFDPYKYSWQALYALVHKGLLRPSVKNLHTYKAPGLYYLTDKGREVQARLIEEEI